MEHGHAYAAEGGHSFERILQELKDFKEYFHPENSLKCHFSCKERNHTMQCVTDNFIYLEILHQKLVTENVLDLQNYIL